MDYTPFQSTGVLTVVMFVLLGATLVCLMPAMALTFYGGETRKTSRILFTIGFSLALVAIGLTVYSIFANLTPDARQHAYFRDAATGLSETYGIEVTEQNIKEMDYPTGEQDERRYFGTSAVKTGPAVNDFITARLAYDDGKVYLLKQVGENYEELTPAR